jgi:aldehyde dehydrogenase (NAD(P)+)
LNVESKETTALESIIARVAANKHKWAAVSLGEKADFLDDIVAQASLHASDWVQKSCAGKNISYASSLAGEEWLSGPFALILAAQEMAGSLRRLAKTGTTLPGRVKVLHSEEKTILPVFPHNLLYRLLLNGVRGELHFTEPLRKADLDAASASAHRRVNEHGQLALVLGAGNISAISALDVLHKLFAENQVAILKMSPVNAYLQPVFEQIFARLLRQGFLAVVTGGADVGATLTRHPDIDCLHMTGSEDTFDKIVFGTAAVGKDKKQTRRPILQKEISAELGGITPLIVVPGPWSQADIDFQAENIALQKLHNAGCNCVATQIIILPQNWSLTPALLQAVRSKLAAFGRRDPYYPGNQQRLADLRQQSPSPDELGPTANCLLFSLEPKEVTHPLMQEEVFTMALGHVSLPASSPGAYLEAAIAFCQEALHGSLGVNIIIHPQTLQKMGGQWRQRLNDLRYGVIGINIWVGAAFPLPQLSWGAYPGNTLAAVCSGIGQVHNSYMLAGIEKSVVYGPFQPFPRNILSAEFGLLPKPPWYLSHQRAHLVGEAMTKLAGSKQYRHLPGLLLNAMRG